MNNRRREETKKVKAALKSAGISFESVWHGQGTSSGWLKVNLGPGVGVYGTPNYIPRLTGGLRGELIALVQKVTGRHGDHDGCIQVLAQ
ncbi:MAG: hypothetical protein NUW09_05445 [Deltaproteobacteria bacterium]|nr:hypothetical protein [Deltaproteobacteria bacterium]